MSGIHRDTVILVNHMAERWGHGSGGPFVELRVHCGNFERVESLTLTFSSYLFIIFTLR